MHAPAAYACASSGPEPPAPSPLTPPQGNSFSGTLPDGYSVLTKLTYLNLQDNSLTKTLPASWSALSKLNYMNLGINQLSSTIPTAWASISPPGLTSLTKLIVASNPLLCGPLPGTWTTSLVTVLDSAVGNACPSPPPAPPSVKNGLLSLRSAMTVSSWSAAGIGGWTADTEPCSGTWDGVTCSGSTVIAVNLASGQLVGSLPSTLSYVTGLQTLVLSSNILSGSVPVDLSALSTSLRRLELASNSLTGTLPTEWVRGA